MSKREVFVSVNVDLKGGEKLGTLAVRQKELQKENVALFKSLKDLETALAKDKITQDQYEKAVKLTTATIGRNRTEIRALSNTLREAENATSGATAAGLRFRDKMSDAFGSKLKASVVDFGKTVGAAFALQNLVQFGNEMAALAVKTELLDKKAKVVFGSTLPSVTAAAEKNANAIGLTKREYIALAAAQQDVFSNLGFGKQKTAELSTNLVDLAGKLEDWAGGEIDASRAAEILQQATLGNTKGLKELGISVKANADEIKARSEQLMAEQGLTKGQADAMANLELVYNSVSGKLAEFSQGQETLDDRVDRSNARLKEAEEQLAQTWGVGWANIKANFFDFLAGLTDMADSSHELRTEFEQQKHVVGSLEKNITPLIDRYDVLSGQTNLSAAEQEEMRSIIEKITAQIPLAATGFDNYGNAIGLSSDKARAFIKDQKDLLAFTNKEAIAEVTKELQKLTAEQEKLGKFVNANNGTFINAGKVYRSTKDGLVELVTVNTKNNQQIIQNAVDQAHANQVLAEASNQYKSLSGQVNGAQQQLSILNGTKLEEETINKVVTPTIVEDGEATKVTTSEKVKEVDAIRALTQAQREFIRVQQEAQQTAPDQLSTIQQAATPHRSCSARIDPKLLVPDQKLLQEYLDNLAKIGEEEAKLHQMRLDRDQVLRDTTIAGIEIISAGMAQGITDTREFQKQLVQSLLQSAHALLRIELAKMSVQALAQPDSVATFGATGAVRIGILTALMEAAFAALSGALQGFAVGGVVGEIQPHHGVPITRSNGDNRLVTVKVGEKILNKQQQRRAETLYGTRVWKDVGLPVRAQSSLLQPFAMGGTVLSQSMPSMSTTQIIQAESSAKLGAINFSPIVTVQDIRNETGDFVNVEDSARL